MKILSGLISLAVTVFIGGLFIYQTGKVDTYSKEVIIEKDDEPMKLAIWEWRKLGDLDAEKYANDAKNENVTDIYLNVNEYTELMELPAGNERSVKLQQYTDKLVTIIKEFQKNDIRVHALGGHNNWGNDSHWYLVDYIVDMVRDFNKAHPETKLAGVHLDIEPYGQANWNKEKIEYIRMYGELIAIQSMRMQRELPGLEFGLSVPVWYATMKYKDQTVLELILKNLKEYDNYLTLMDYRNFTGGNDGSIALAKPAFRQAKGKNIEIIIGQETGRVLPSKVTFYGMKKKDLENAIGKLRNEFDKEPQFAGIAINSWQSYRQLGQ